jgi:lipopolysaccharide biosynthesis glycosyltransferase
MNQQERVKVFIGSGEASLLERKTLIHSLRKHSQRELDIYVLHGTHNAIELNDREPFLAPMSLRVKYRNGGTEFSLYRFLIPEICNYQGKAIYVDSDIVSLSDIGELFNTPMNGCSFLAKKGAYRIRPDLWGLSVMLIDCEKSRFDLEAIFDEIDQGLYDYTEFMGMSRTFLAHHPYTIGELAPHWNVLDYCDKDTKLIHYTSLYTQPWKYPNHPYGEVWFKYFNEAVASGYITEQDIKLSMLRSYVRRDLLKGNFSFLGRESNYLKQAIRPLKQVTMGAVKKVIKRPILKTKPV